MALPIYGPGVVKGGRRFPGVILMLRIICVTQGLGVPVSALCARTILYIIY